MTWAGKYGLFLVAQNSRKDVKAPRAVLSDGAALAGVVVARCAFDRWGLTTINECVMILV